MKRSHSYEINHLDKTVTITRRFLEEATQMDTPAAKLMEQFIARGYTVTVYQKASRKAAKPEDGKLPLLTYRMMEGYISMLDDAEEMLAVFKSVYIIGGDRPITEQAYQRTWERINRTINMHGATAHIFRHTFATIAAPFLDIKTLQSIMGHADIETTLDRYTHAQEQRICAAGQLLTGKFKSGEI